MQKENYRAAPRLGIGLGIDNRDLIFEVIVVYAADAFDDVELVAVRMPDAIEPGLVVEIQGVGDENVTVPVSDRIEHQQRAESLIVLSPVGENLVPHGIPLE